MELYILSKRDLSIQSVSKLADYQINLDEETNGKSIFTLIKCKGLKEGNFIVINGLFKQFLFVIPDGGIETEKGSNLVTVTALDISNIFDRKIIEKDTSIMTTDSIEKFLANAISENFVNSDDQYINKSYIDIYWHTNTKAVVNTNAENGLYNFHTFLINCRQAKNICTDFKFVNGRLRIDIENKEDTIALIDTTLAEVTDYNKVYEADYTAKVQVLIREDNSIYNLYLKTDRTTTEDKNDTNRATGKVETISVDTKDKAREEALNVMKGNTYKHLVEFKIAKSSKLIDISRLYIGRKIKIKTEDDIYDSYISAITLNNENFVYFKSGNLRIDLLDKLKKRENATGNKLDISGGKILGDLDIVGDLRIEGKRIDAFTEYVDTGATVDLNDYTDQGWYFFTTSNSIANIPAGVNGWLQVIKDKISGTWTKQVWYRAGTANSNDYQTYVRTRMNGVWSNWKQYQMVEDTGWKTLTLTSDFHTYEDNSANTPQYRKIGKVIEIVGAIAPTSNISAGTNKTIATLPEGYRPSKKRYFICQGSGRAIWTLYVYSNGNVIFSRYGKSEYADASTDVWLPFNITFLID